MASEQRERERERRCDDDDDDEEDDDNIISSLPFITKKLTIFIYIVNQVGDQCCAWEREREESARKQKTKSSIIPPIN